MTTDRVTEEEVKDAIAIEECSALLYRLLSERTTLEARLAEAETRIRTIIEERDAIGRGRDVVLAEARRGFAREMLNVAEAAISAEHGEEGATWPEREILKALRRAAEGKG